MSLTYDQAVAELARLTDGRIATASELRTLASQVSSYSEGSTTVLYSGKLADGTDSSAVVKAMIANGEDVRAIGNTNAAEFLDSRVFKHDSANRVRSCIATPCRLRSSHGTTFAN